MYTTSEDIPSIPFFNSPEEYKQFCQMLIEKGAIPKNKLKNKTKYYGSCRNADYAVWNAESQKFCYERWKHGIVSIDYVNHFEDDDGYDLFIPIKECTEEIKEPVKPAVIKPEEPIDGIRARSRNKTF